jgi:hypothetical protein
LFKKVGLAALSSCQSLKILQDKRFYIDLS